MTAKKTGKTSQRTETSSVTPFTIARFNTDKDTTFQSVETFMNTSKNQWEKITSDANSTSREHVDAFIRSGKIAMKGVEEIIKTISSLTQDYASKNSEVIKSLMSCKTINELTEAQNALAKKSFEDIMQTTTKLSELSIRVATESFEPISTQLTKAVKKASERAAS